MKLPPKDMEYETEVVISGVAGSFPECANIDELEEALFRKAHLVTDDDRLGGIAKLHTGDFKYSKHSGKAFPPDKFDATFFNIPFSFPSVMDPVMKKCMETSVEAIIDAGLNPHLLEGTNTAVYSTYDNSESELVLPFTPREKVLMGNCRTLTANRLSFALNLNGPSYAFQGGCGSIFHYFDYAKRQLEERTIDAAIVVCGNCIMSDCFLAVLSGMGLSASDGKCCSFDDKAHGYALSESCVAFFLQRAEDARRNWATIVGAGNKFFGRKEPGTNFLSFDHKPAKKMLREMYIKWRVDPAEVEYVEADGSGVKDRDSREIYLISETFCKDRDKPLLIGSLKSNMGHADTAACGAGTVKALIALNKSKIPPNIHLESPNSKISPLKIQVVTDTTPFSGKYVGVNAIGLAGSFGHALLRKNSKEASTMNVAEPFPQILLLSSRTEGDMSRILEKAKTSKNTPEFAALLNGVFENELKGHMYRGYIIKQSDGTVSPPKSQQIDGSKRPIWWVFSGMGSQWNAMGSYLIHIPIFYDVIDRCDRVLAPHGVDIKHILTSTDERIFDNILHSFVGITAVQIGLVEILRALGLEPDFILGHSVGELGCAYADNCMTLEQTILAAHARGRASLETNLIPGMMAAIGLGYHDIVGKIPKTIDVACHNSSTSCTISGPTADVEQFVGDLKAGGVFAKSVNVANIAYHSRYIQPAAPVLLKYLREVITTNTKRSPKWISSSVPRNNWLTNSALYNSPEYHTNNLLSPVLFEDAIKNIPQNAVVIEIAPHGLLQAILKRALPDTVANIPLTKRSSSSQEVNGVEFLLNAIGQLYMLGFQPKVSRLYPAVEYPVPCDTPSLQPFVTWEHSETYAIPDYLKIFSAKSGECEQQISTAKITEALSRYEANGNPVFPLSFFLVEVWKILGNVLHKSFKDISIAFEGVHTHTDPDSSIHDSNEIWVSVLPGSGDFVVTLESRKEGKNTVEETNKMLYSGKIKALENPRYDSKFKELSMNNEALRTVDFDSINRCFSSKINDDQSYAGTRIFELQECQRGLSGEIVWNKDWVVNLDSILKINAFKDGYLEKPVSVQYLRILPGQMHTIETGSKVDFIFDSTLHYFECVGVKIDGMKTQHPEIKSIRDEVTEYLHFVPYGNTSFSTEYEFLLACLQLIKENATDGAADSMGTVKINVTQRKSRAGELMFGLLKYILQIQDMDQHVELVRMEPRNGCVSASDTYLSILTEPKSFLQLIHMKNFKNAYLFTTMPKDVTLQSVIDYAAANGQDYVILYEQVFDTKRFGFLRKIDVNEKFRICEVTKNWSSSVEALKYDTHLGDESIILLFNRPPLANPVVITQEILKEISVSNVKCFLSWGEGLPPFSVDRNFYSEQIKRGMVINVLVNGQWGTYRRQSIPQQQANLTQVLHLLEQSVEGVSVNFVSPVLNTEIGHSILDYAGISSSGEQVVGIAQSNEQGAKGIKLDPVFQWKLQDNVNLEDAVTMPYAYLMAHLALLDFAKHEGKKTVLIHSGHKPVGVACIAVALSAGHTVYTTAPDALGMETIKSLFGQIPASHITNYNSGDFFVPLMLGTNGRGADIIVSDLPREEMIASWHSVAQYGCFVNLNEEMPAEHAQLPMSQFLKSVSYFSYSTLDILFLPDHRKKQLHRSVHEFLKSKQAVAIPHKTASIDEMQYRPGLIKTTQKERAKLVLTIPTTHLCHNDQGKIDHGRKLTQYDPEQVYLILSSNLKRSASLIEWLLDRNVNKIVLATTESIGSSHAARKINEHVSKQNASVLMTSAGKARSPSGAEELLAQATLLGEVTAIYSVAFDMDTEIVKNIQKAARKQNKSCSFINIWDESSAFSFDDSISVVCDSHLDYTHALDHASLLSTGSIVCVTEKRTKTIQPRKKDDSEILADKITDYLPSSLEELDMIGQCLSAKDTVSSSEEYAKFFPVPSRAISGISRTDTRPVFLIPAFCETQLRPLISRLMYPCFVAHIHHKAPSINQVVLNLLRSAFQIQKLGPFTIVAETWSGGIGMLLSRILTDSGHEVSLFLLQGVPSRLCSMLPSHDLNEFLVTTLIGINAKNNKRNLNKYDESELLENAFNLLTPDNKKFYAVRAFKAVKKSLEFLREFAESSIKLRSKIFLIENENLNQLTSKEIEQMSEKIVEVIKLKRKTYRELIIDPTVATTISREAPFSWNI